MASVSVKINGNEYSVPAGSTILDACLDAGMDIPRLCYHKKLDSAGNCRVCVVEVEGMNTLPPSCVTPVAENMVINTQTPAVNEARKVMVNLLLAAHNCDCLVCEAAGNCELQDLAYELGIDIRSRMFENYREDLEPADRSSPVLQYDPSKCIMCTRCVRACSNIQGKGILAALHRGAEMTVGTGVSEWSNSACDGCGECIQICPVGALSEKDSPGVRSWEVEKIRTSCAYCGVGCQLDMWVHHNKLVKVEGADTEPNFGSTCVKGRFGHTFVNRDDRLETPLIRRNGRLEKATWSEAIALVAEKIGDIRDKYGADAVAGLCSAKVTNEENYLFQKMMRAAIGTNSVDHCARLCHASTVTGLAAAFGSGAMTNSIAELEHAKCILVTGSNTTETHPVIAAVIRRAVRKHGAKLIVVDPRRIDLVKDAAVWLRQKNGTDVAWLNGLMNVIINENLHDTAFIKQKTAGFEEMRRVVELFTPEKVERITGIPCGEIVEAARMFAEAEVASIVYSMGITQHITGTDNVLSVANLAMLTGNVGRASSGVNPLRGQNNVQGACDVGGLPDVYPGYQKVTDPANRKKFEQAWEKELPPDNGLTVMEIIDSLETGKVKGLIIMGENPMVSDPNLNHAGKALDSVEFLVVSDIFLTETAEKADVVLPAASFAEKNGTFTNTERRVILVRKALDAPGDARSDWEIICDLSSALGYPMSYSSASEIMDEIAELTPIYGGIHHDRIQEVGLQWPCSDRSHPGTMYLHEGKFKRGTGQFHPVDFIPPAESPDSEYPFILSTGRILYHYHTGSMTRRVDALNEFVSGAYAEIHPADVDRLGLVDGGPVKLRTRRGEIETTVKSTEIVAEGSVFVPFHFAESAANVLTNDSLDPAAKIPELKVAACQVSKV